MTPNTRRIRVGITAAAAAVLVALGAVPAAAAHATSATSFVSERTVGAVPAVSGATAPAPVGDIAWSVAPAGAQGADGRISLRHAIDPGTTVSDAVVVTNTGAVAAEFAVAAGDGMVGADGAFDIARGEPTGAGSWIVLDGLDSAAGAGAGSAGILRLEPGEHRVLPLTISVPANATPGDHPAGIVVGVAQSSGGVTVTHRLGVRLHLQVTGALSPALEVVDATVSYEPSAIPFAPGVATVDYTLANTGNVRLGAAVGVTVSGPFGLGSARTAAAEPIELLPGATTTHTAQLDVAPWVFLTGEVRALPVAIGADALSGAEVAVLTLSALGVSWSTLGVLIALLALIALFVVLRIRRRRRSRRARASGTAPADPADAAHPEASAPATAPTPADGAAESEALVRSP